MGLKIFDINDLINETIRRNDMEDCFSGECKQCSTKSPTDILTKSINVDLDENYS